MRLTQLSPYAAVAAAIAAPLAFMAPAAASAASAGSPVSALSAKGGASTAFGLAADGLVTIPRTPSVSSAARPNDKSLAELPPNPLVDLKVLHVTAVPGHARSSVVDLEVAKAGLSAHLITARCAGGSGSSRLVDARLGGRRLVAGTTPNAAVAVPVRGLGTVSVVINKQVRNPGGGVTVTALEVSLPLPTGGSQTISISSVTCAAGRPGTPGSPSAPSSPTAKPTPSPTSSAPAGEAPRPTPVPTDLPVTG